jgi:hypothetical protein
MLIDKIVGAITFKKGVYASVAADQAFTSNAWLIVVVAAVLNQFGSRASTIGNGFFRYFIGSVFLSAVAVGAFAVAVFLVARLSGAMFKANVTFEQAARALGLAYIWRVVGFIGILSVIPLLGCLTAPISILAWLAGLAADLFAVKESTNMEWTGTIVVAVIATVATWAILGIAALILGLFRLIL